MAGAFMEVLDRLAESSDMAVFGVDDEYEAMLARAQELADMIEAKALAHLYNSAKESQSAIGERLETWRQDEQRFFSEKKVLDDDNWFSRINPPRGARIIDMHKARMFQSTIPDTHRLDFFNLTPEAEQFEGQLPDEQDAQYAEMATIAVRNDLINGRFMDDYDDALTDYYVFGNMYLMPVWELSIQFRFENAPNPEYDPNLPPEMNVRKDILDGVEVLTPIRPTIRKRFPVRQFDAPKLRHIRATNVFPTELDRNKASDCTGVFFYDTCRLSDLRDGAIADGGYFYANLDKLSMKNERTDVPEIPGTADNYLRDATRKPKSEISRALDRLTYLGRLRVDELIEDMGLTEEIKSEAGQMAMGMLAEKFSWEQDKLSNWNTWVAELVDDGKYMVRWQPSPYEEDRIPLVHKKLFGISKRTLGDSVYDRIREEEHARNKMSQLRLMHTQKIVEPPVMVVKDYVEPRWWNAMGGTLKYKRNMMIPGLKGANINQTIQTMDFSPVPLQVTDAAVAMLDNQISESAHLPAVRQGLASGGQTATEVSQMGASADVMTDYMAKRVEFAFLEEAIEWLLLLHHQYTEEPRLVHYYDQQGDLVFKQVPPEVWTRRYKVNLHGWESIGNRDVRAMNFQEFAKVVQAYGWQNPEGLLAEYAHILQVRNPMRMIKQPEPQEPQPTLSSSDSFALNAEFLPASVTAEIIRKRYGIEITPEQEQEMVALHRARAVREVADQANVPIPLEAALPPEWAPSSPQQEQPMGGMGQPGAQPGASPEELRDHHPPGEMETRQMGLHDAKGLQNSLGKRMQNPMNARRVTGV